METPPGEEAPNKKPAASPAIPWAVNFSLAVFHLMLNLHLVFLLPLFLLPLSPWWGLTALVVAAWSNPFWSLIHEAIHDMFHPSRRVNVAVARALAILFGSPFRVLRTSHLLHHKLNRHPIEGTELFDPATTTRLRASLGYYSYIFGGLHVLEVLSSLFFLMPKFVLLRIKDRAVKEGGLRGIFLGSVAGDHSLAEIRGDGLAVVALFSLSFFCYGRDWLWLASALLVRAFLISFLDNMYHYGTPVRDVFYAENLWLPTWASMILLHFHLHGVHHRNPALPWIRLPEVFRLQSKTYDGNYFAAAARQLSGPIPLPELSRSYTAAT